MRTPNQRTSVCRANFRCHYYTIVRICLAIGLTIPLVAKSAGAWQQASEGLSKQPADALYQKGMELLRQQRYAEALEQFRLLEQETPRSPQGPTGAGIALALMG